MAMEIIYSGNVNKGGKSSVYIVRYTGSVMTIWFRDRGGNTAKYKYTKSEVGRTHFTNMKELANRGKGLNSYIHRYKLKGKRV